jgi:hypothetical protein
MPNEELVDWIGYLKLKEAREKRRMIEALTYVALQLFPKKEEK